MYYVYILRCNNGSTYTGCTKDLKERFQRHINGHVPATKHLLSIYGKAIFIVQVKAGKTITNVK
jgi:predicted GIY-YIG superfamily endonuclease